MKTIKLLCVTLTVFVLLIDLSFAQKGGMVFNSHSFDCSIDSELGITINTNNQNIKIKASTNVQYTLEHKGRLIILTFDHLAVKTAQDNKIQMNVTMNRDKFTDGTSEILTKNANPKLKQMLENSFKTPICNIEVDDNGAEVKRTITAKKGAVMVDQIATARLFHPLFFVDKKQWSATRAMPLGAGNYVTGKLVYTKARQKGEKILVKISGTLTNKGWKQNALVEGKNAVYKVKGSQVYNTKKKEWVLGKLVCEISYHMESNGAPIGVAKGAMIIKLQELK